MDWNSIDILAGELIRNENRPEPDLELTVFNSHTTILHRSLIRIQWWYQNWPISHIRQILQEGIILQNKQPFQNKYQKYSKHNTNKQKQKNKNARPEILKYQRPQMHSDQPSLANGLA